MICPFMSNEAITKDCLLVNCALFCANKEGDKRYKGIEYAVSNDEDKENVGACVFKEIALALSLDITLSKKYEKDVLTPCMTTAKNAIEQKVASEKNEKDTEANKAVVGFNKTTKAKDEKN